MDLQSPPRLDRLEDLRALKVDPGQEGFVPKRLEGEVETRSAGPAGGACRRRNTREAGRNQGIRNRQTGRSP